MEGGSKHGTDSLAGKCRRPFSARRPCPRADPKHGTDSLAARVVPSSLAACAGDEKYLPKRARKLMLTAADIILSPAPATIGAGLRERVTVQIPKACAFTDESGAWEANAARV